MSRSGTASMVRHDVEVDVSGSCGIDGQLNVVATLRMPPLDAVANCATVVFALPGGHDRHGGTPSHL